VPSWSGHPPRRPQRARRCSVRRRKRPPGHPRERCGAKRCPPGHARKERQRQQAQGRKPAQRRGRTRAGSTSASHLQICAWMSVVGPQLVASGVNFEAKVAVSRVQNPRSAFAAGASAGWTVCAVRGDRLRGSTCRKAFQAVGSGHTNREIGCTMGCGSSVPVVTTDEIHAARRDNPDHPRGMSSGRMQLLSAATMERMAAEVRNVVRVPAREMSPQRPRQRLRCSASDTQGTNARSSAPKNPALRSRTPKVTTLFKRSRWRPRPLCQREPRTAQSSRCRWTRRLLRRSTI